MSIQFNDEQLKAINAINQNVIVSASAGAGKTTVLVGRLMKRILQDHISVKEIVAMTFTEKAASEMKKRLTQALNDVYQQTRDPEIKNELIYIQDAQISTIHSFCLSIIKEFGYLIGLDPQRAQTILDEAQTHQLTQQALDKTIEYALESSNQETFKTLLNFLNARVFSLEELKDILLDFSQSSMVHLNPQQWLLQSKQLYQAQTICDYPADIQSLLFDAVENLIDNLKKAVDDFEFEVSRLESKKQGNLVDLVVLYQQCLVELEAFFEQKDFDQLAVCIEKLLTPPIKIPPKQDELKGARDHLVELFKSDLMMALLNGDDALLLSEQANFVDLLIDLTLYYQKQLEWFKQQAQGLSFDDMEHFAYQILIHPSHIAQEAYQHRFKEILVDEFQDSNFFQNEIVNLIAYNNNVFRVGDIKQSIYKFRHARPSLMRAIMQLNDHNNLTLYLSNNFRSTQKIVDFSNLLFQQAMNIPGLPDRYSPQDTVSIGDPKRQAPSDQMPVSIVTLDKQQEVKQMIYGELQAIDLSKDERIASWISQDIQTKIESKKYSYKDICILVKGHDRKRALKKYFDLYQIPYYFNDKDGFYNADVINDVTHFIQYCLNPQEDLHLLWILMSKFYFLSEDDLAKIKLVNPKQSLSKNLKDVFPDISNQLEKIITLSKQLTPLDFIHHLIQLNNYYDVHCDLQQKTNLDLLVSIIANQTTGLKGIVDMIQASKSLKSSSAASESENADVVKVMTIHASKGLQFPLVYLFSQPSIQQRDLSSKIMVDSDWGLSMLTLDPQQRTYQSNLLRYVFSRKNRIEEASENLRLLYVALTRPQKELIIVDQALETPDTLTIENLLKGKVFTSVILSVLNERTHPLYQIIDGHIKDLPNRRLVTYTKAKPIHKPEIKEIPIDLTLDSISFNNQSLHDTSLQKQRGTLLHESIAKLPHRLWTDQDLVDIDPSLTETLLAYNRHPLTQQCYQQSIEHEAAISYLENHALIYGYIDFVAMDDSSITLIDFKSDIINSPLQLIDRYRDQLAKYYRGLSLLYPNKTITTYLYSFHLNDYIRIKL